MVANTADRAYNLFIINGKAKIAVAHGLTLKHANNRIDGVKLELLVRVEVEFHFIVQIYGL